MSTLVLGACVSAVDFSQWASGYNKAVEQSHNENLLLNMVRVAYNRPMHFSTISVVRGNGQVTRAVSALLPMRDFLALARNGASLSPSFAVTSGFNFDMASLDTAEFLSGFLTQISASTIHYYVNQGVPRELLFNLFIEQLEISVGGRTQVYDNDPNTPGYQKFTEALRNLLTIGLTTESVILGATVGPILSETEAKDPLRQQTLMQPGMAMEKISSASGSGYKLVKYARVARFCFKADENMREKLPAHVLCGAAERHAGQADQTLGVGSAYKEFGDASLMVVPRSTSGVFNYLGNLIYRQAESSPPYRLALKSEEMKNYNYLGRGDDLIRVLKNQPHEGDLVRVEFEGATYSVPAEQQGHSALVMSIVSQVLNLSKSVNSIPVSSSVILR